MSSLSQETKNAIRGGIPSNSAANAIIAIFENLLAAVSFSTGRLTALSLLTPASGINFPVAEVTADGDSQATAVALVAGAMNVVAGGDDTKGVILPSAAATGAAILVLNSGTAGLTIYPADADKINNGTANAAIVILENTAALLIPTADDNWAAIYTANA